MNRRLISILVLIALAAVVVWAGVIYWPHSVSINIEPESKDNPELIIYRVPDNDHEVDLSLFLTTDNEVERINAPKVVSLRNGDYVLTSEHEDFEEIVIPFDVRNSSTQVDVTLNFSANKLSSVLAAEAESIELMLLSSIPQLGQGYVLGDGSLYGQGEWYGNTITEVGPESDEDLFEGDVFRVLAQKQKDQWVLISTPPDLVLTKFDYPKVPIDILKAVNDLES